MSSRPECPDCGERWCLGGSSGDGCGVRNTAAYERSRVASHTPKFYLCFLDFETAGLDPQRHEPIEVAAVVTDDRLNELGRFESLIAPNLAPSYWDAPAREMHERSGLGWAARSKGVRRDEVAVFLYDFLTVTLPASAPLHLAGNSVHFDRSFLRTYFPAIEQRFHHRHLDVSSLRMAGEIFTNAATLSGEKPHRAMADVLRSIQELHHWRAALREP